MTKKNTIAPRDVARDFRVQEVFFSTTDRHGIIVLGNSVFVRISGYELSDLVGSSHNVVRHPDMPRAVFRMFWRELLADKPVAAYVKNLAADGSYYWVVTIANPIPGGFLSVRFKPTCGLLPEIEELYKDMVGAEGQHKGRGDGGKAGMDAAEELLVFTLREKGFPDYVAFMRAMLSKEFYGRERALEQAKLETIKRIPSSHQLVAAGSIEATIRSVHTDGLALYTQLKHLCSRLSEFADMDEKLGRKSDFVMGLGREFGIISINAALESTKLGEQGASLEVIARYLGEASGQISKVVGGLTTRIHEALEVLHSVVFNLICARLQVEMTLLFCQETIAEMNKDSHAIDAVRGDSLRRMVTQLQIAFSDTSRKAAAALGTLAHDVAELSQLSHQLHRTLTTLKVAHISGMVEANRLNDEGGFGGMFGEVRTQIEKTRAELTDFEDIIARLGLLAREAPQITTAVKAAVDRMDVDVQHLAAEEPAAALA